MEKIYTCILLSLLCMMQNTDAKFSGEECLQTHNELRGMHISTPALRYSPELEKEAQKFADKLASDDTLTVPTRDLPKRRRRRANPTKDPFFHKELWNGEILFPHSASDLNNGRTVKIGESIHKFCCYSFPLCPREFFYNLNFPPSAKGVVGQFYKEVSNYDFANGRKKLHLFADDEIRHFTNIVWKESTEVGCAQSKRNSRGCIYSVIRYKSEGSTGGEEEFKANVQPAGPNGRNRDNSDGKNSSAVALIVTIVVLLLIVALCIMAFFKRDRLKAYFAEYRMKQGTKRAEASLRDNPDAEGGMRRQSILTRFSFKKTKPSIYMVPNPAPTNAAPFQAREPAPVYQNLPVACRPGEETVAFMGGLREGNNGMKSRSGPKSPVKPGSTGLQPDRSTPPPAQKPPTPQWKMTSTPSSLPVTSPNAEAGKRTDKAVPKPYVNLDFGGNPPPKPTSPPGAKASADGVARAPVPVPRYDKVKPSNNTPKPAPRPARPADAKQQFEPREIVPGSASRTSKKNPNFRTLPLNDRGSLVKPGRPKVESDSGENGVSFHRSNTKKDPKKLAFTHGKKTKPVIHDPSKKPFLAKSLRQVDEEPTNQTSVAEMRRLLEQKNTR